MLVIKPKTQGAGIFDVISKVANSALAKKVINSTVGKKVIEKATKENLVKAANSAIGKQVQTAIVKGVADASEKVANSTFQKLGLPPGTVARAAENAANSTLKEIGITPAEKEVLEQVFTATTLPKKRKQLSYTPGRSKKRKRAKALGTGIILE